MQQGSSEGSKITITKEYDNALGPVVQICYNILKMLMLLPQKMVLRWIVKGKNWPKIAHAVILRNNRIGLPHEVADQSNFAAFTTEITLR